MTPSLCFALRPTHALFSSSVDTTTSGGEEAEAAASFEGSLSRTTPPAASMISLSSDGFGFVDAVLLHVDADAKHLCLPALQQNVDVGFG